MHERNATELCKEDTREQLIDLINALINSGIFPDCKIEKSSRI